MVYFSIFGTMTNKLRNGIALSLIPQIILVIWLGNNPKFVETYYSKKLYPFISEFFRTLFGWIPFSLGDIIYTLLILIAIRYFIKNRHTFKNHPFRFLRDLAMTFSVFYFTFNLVWGLNYYRTPVAEKLTIRDSIQYQEIVDLSEKLIAKTNQIQLKITGDSSQMVNVPYNRNEILKKTIQSYKELETEFPFLHYNHPSLKKSIYSTLSSYLGIGGYLNPFTNEAQVNAKIPLFRFPVVSGHEVAHQVGYSKENETNFIGYLVTMKNDDIYFQYAAYAYALSHCLGALRRTNPVAFEAISANVNTGVKKNYQELRDFNQKYENPFEPIFKSVFNTFLKANQQKDGIKSYGKIVELVVGYHEKHPI